MDDSKPLVRFMRWRWTPCIALASGSVLFALIAIAAVPDEVPFRAPRTSAAAVLTAGSLEQLETPPQDDGESSSRAGRFMARASQLGRSVFQSTPTPAEPQPAPVATAIPAPEPPPPPPPPPPPVVQEMPAPVPPPEVQAPPPPVDAPMVQQPAPIETVQVPPTEATPPPGQVTNGNADSPPPAGDPGDAEAADDADGGVAPGQAPGQPPTTN